MPEALENTRRKSEPRSEEHTSELQSLRHLVCRLLLEKKTLREGTKRIFPRHGYPGSTAANGPEARDIARDHPGEIHLLVTFLIMPHTPGNEALPKILAIQP